MRRFDGAPIPQEVFNMGAESEVKKVSLDQIQALLEKAALKDPAILEEARVKVLEINPDAFAGEDRGDDASDASMKFVDPVSAAAVLGGVAAAIAIGKETYGFYKWLREKTGEDASEGEA